MISASANATMIQELVSFNTVVKAKIVPSLTNTFRALGLQRVSVLKKSALNVRTFPHNESKTWSRLGDSNSGPTHYESVQTLTDEVRAWGYVREVVSSRRI
jgi:hypothetical protein